MSYCVFGLIEHCEESVAPTLQTIRDLATANRIWLWADGDIPQKVVHEMIDLALGKAKAGIRFLLVADPAQDTSDSLVSPFGCPPEAISIALRSVGRWAMDVVAIKAFPAIHILLSDGYDDAFVNIELIPGRIDVRLSEALARDDLFPSLANDMMSPIGHST